tara:strand:+ start:2015 stop:2944 length:930 start_codon:yes stop_codon:yes gene_type:complete
MSKKVILFGCQAISIEILRFLHAQSDVEVVKVITYEVVADISRGQESIKTVATELGIDVSSPSRISSELVEEIKNAQPDLIISAYYRKIFPKKLIDIPPLGIINIHPSLLPHYRGPVPTAWAILNGESEFGITIHKVDTGIDTGDILVQASYPIGDDETGFELYLRAMALGASLLIKHFSQIIENKIIPTKQSKGGSYYGKLKTRTNLDWKQSAEMIKNNVRIRAHPYNPIETILDNKYFFINKVKVIYKHDFPIQIPGRILKVADDDTFIVSCSDGVVHVLDYGVYPSFTDIEKKLYLKVGRIFDDEI